MRTKLTKIALAASVLLAMAFTFSCSTEDNDEGESSSSGTGTDPGSSSGTGTGTDPGSSSSGGSNGQGSAFNLNSQIYSGPNCWYDEDIDDDVCSTTAYNDGGSVEDDSYTRIGTVTNGRVTGLQLGSITIPSEDYEFYDPFYFDEEDIASCSQYTELSIYEATFNLKDTDDDPVGTLRIRNEDGNEKLYYWYSKTAGKVVCNIDNGYGVNKYNLDIKVGWNEVYIKSNDFTYSTEYSTNSSILTSSLKWFVISNFYPW